MQATNNEAKQPTHNEAKQPTNQPNSSGHVLMIRPVSFRMNEQTAVNNYYQQVLHFFFISNFLFFIFGEQKRP